MKLLNTTATAGKIIYQNAHIRSVYKEGLIGKPTTLDSLEQS